jgi:hypothetical protein
MPLQPIGYADPAPGAKLALGLAAGIDAAPRDVSPFGAPLADPRDNPLTRTLAEGIATWGRGQAPTAATSAPRIGRVSP